MPNAILQRFISFKAKLAAAIAVFLLIMSSGLWMPLAPPPVFDVAARIWIQQRNAQEIGERAGTLMQSFMTYFNSPIVTACEVIKSSQVLTAAATALKSKLVAADLPTVGALKAGIKVEPVQGTDIIAVNYRHASAYVAVTTVQAVIDAFMRLQAHQASYSTMQSKTFLTDQLTEAKKQLKAMSGKIKNFEATNNIVDPNQEAQDVLHRRAAVEEALREAETKVKEDEQRAKYFESHLGHAKSGIPDQSQELMATEAKKKLAELHTEYSELSTVYRPEHPRMRQLTSLMKRLQKTASSYPDLSAFSEGGNNSPEHGLTGSRESLVQQLFSAKSDEMVQRARAAIIAPQLGSLAGQLKNLPAKQIELADLIRAQKVIADRVSDLESQLNSAKFIEAIGAHNDNFQVIDPPEVTNVTIVSRRPKLMAVFLLAAFMGAATFFVLDFLDPRLRRISTVLKILPATVVAWLPEIGTFNLESLEPVHRLRLSLRGWLADGGKQIVITSSDPYDGKSVLAAGLAMSFAQSGVQVLLVDANSKRPRLHQSFNNLPPLAPGLSEFLDTPDPTVWSNIVFNVNKNLKLVTAGGKSGGKSLLSSEKLPQLIEKAKAEADVVIYNTPAGSESAAALALLSPETYLLVVVRMNHTHAPALRLLATQLKHHAYGAMGLVLVNTDDFAVASALSRAGKEEIDEVEALPV